MPHEDQIIKEIFSSITELDKNRAKDLVSEAIVSKVDPLSTLEKGVVAGVRAVGEMFERGEYFLPELIHAGEIADVCIKELVPHLPAGSGKPGRKVVLATVKGDLHNIGKNLVGLMLRINGFEVHDLGIDIPTMQIIEAAEELQADIIALSSLMAVTMTEQREVIRYLVDMGLRDKYRVLIGGGPTTREFAQSIGADGWAKTAGEAVKVAEELASARRGT